MVDPTDFLLFNAAIGVVNPTWPKWMRWSLGVCLLIWGTLTIYVSWHGVA